MLRIQWWISAHIYAPITGMGLSAFKIKNPQPQPSVRIYIIDKRMPFLALQKERERVISSLGENELQASLDSSALLLLLTWIYNHSLWTGLCGWELSRCPLAGFSVFLECYLLSASGLKNAFFLLPQELGGYYWLFHEDLLKRKGLQ